MIAHLKGLKISEALRLPSVRISHDADGVITRAYSIVPLGLIKDDTVDSRFLDNFEKACLEYGMKGQATVSQWMHNDRTYTAVSVNA